jgi:hypothetical protein
VSDKNKQTQQSIEYADETKITHLIHMYQKVYKSTTDDILGQHAPLASHVPVIFATARQAEPDN